MTHTAGLAAAALGLLARLYSLKRLRGTRDLRRFRKLQGAFRGAVIFILVKLYRFRFRRAFERTRFELPNLGISDPFRRLHELVTAPEEKDPPRFMIHAGDQIYFDVPFPNLEPRHSEYRRTYRQTWFEAPKLRQFLAECPHYMILDDHDIVNRFDNDRPMPAGRDPRDYSTPALAAYEEIVHCRQRDANGSEHFFYTFDYGSVPFFVLDTRTERSASKEQMIEGPQLKKFTEWLCTHSDKLKFVVSSVAFVAELRAPDQRRGSASSGANGEYLWADDRNDKWCGPPFGAAGGDPGVHILQRRRQAGVPGRRYALHLPRHDAPRRAGERLDAARAGRRSGLPAPVRQSRGFLRPVPRKHQRRTKRARRSAFPTSLRSGGFTVPGAAS